MSRVAILWHLHQPDYRLPAVGGALRRPLMPWARLHALRGYRDMVVDALEHEPPVTLNVVPSLLEQLQGYADGAEDDHLALTRRPAESLSGAEVRALRETFVAGHERMIRAFPAWAALAGRVRSDEPLTVGELRDAQVWSTLVWFGATAARDLPAIEALRRKGRGFDEADKAALLDAHDAVVRALPGQLRAVAGTRTGLSVSPAFHPILPLLVDVQHARRCGQAVPPDLRFVWPGDAALQLQRARVSFEAWFGRPPAGLWPSEGSVSPEVVRLAGEAGFSWLCTDDGVLRRSRREGAGGGPWDLGHGVRGFFRDHDLSDRIGFQYQDRRPEDAVAELLGVAGERATHGLCVLALDGENPWEAWPQAGGPFRARLWQALERGPVRGVTLDEAARAPVCGRIHALHTGSWIGADLHIWAGDAADHAAWRALARTREVVEGSPRRADALEHVLAAEGSDWFWWFGPEFDTPFAATFDRLFRAHLQAAWEVATGAAPAWLEQPIARARAWPAPAGLVAPELDAVRWEHWRGAARAPWPRGSTMAGGQAPIAELVWGWDDRGALWLLLPWREGPCPGVRLRIGPDVLEVPAGGVGVAGEVTAARQPEGVVVRWTGRGDAAITLWLEDADGGRVVLPPDGAVVLSPPEIGPALAHWSV